MVKRGPSSRGYALLMALFALVLTLSAAALLALALELRMGELRRASRGLQLTAITDAGVALTLARLSVDPAWAGQPEEPFGDGTLAIDVREGADWRERIVTLRARYHHGRRMVEVRILLPPGDPPRVRAWRRLPFF